MAVRDISNLNGGKQYIHDGDRFVPTKFVKALIYLPILEPTQWELNNIIHIMLTSDHPWDPTSIDNELEGKVVFLNRYGADDDLYDLLCQINAAEIHVDLDYPNIKVDDMIT